jgi:hypothetical protein
VEWQFQRTLPVIELVEKRVGHLLIVPIDQKTLRANEGALEANAGTRTRVFSEDPAGSPPSPRHQFASIAVLRSDAREQHALQRSSFTNSSSKIDGQPFSLSVAFKVRVGNCLMRSSTSLRAASVA